jgi:hypothetical protein
MADFFTGGHDPGASSAWPAPLPADREGMRVLERSGTLKYFEDQAREGAPAAKEPRAGIRTECLARSQTALDYASARLEGGRTFLMDDYDAIGRTSRRPAPTADSVASLLGYQAAPEPFSQGGGLATTKFGAGFTRRQQRDIRQDGARRVFEEERSQRWATPATPCSLLSTLHLPLRSPATSPRRQHYLVLRSPATPPLHSKAGQARPDAQSAAQRPAIFLVHGVQPDHRAGG